MSGIGKTSTGFKKVEFQESKTATRLQKSLRFAHEATAGETSLNLSALVPPSTMATYGFINPNPSDLASADLLSNRNNLILKSSIRGVMEEHLDYVVSGDLSIQFINPFVALPGEIFTGVIQNALKTGTLVTDAQQFAVSDSLAAGATDILLPFPIPTVGITGSQIPSIAVFRNGVLQVQNAGNSPVGLGNYYLVASSNGYSSLLRFNDAAVVEEGIVIFPIGYLPSTTGTVSFNLKLAGFADAIVGDSTMVTAGQATHTSIQSAINSVPAGGKVFVLEGTYTENITVNKKVVVEGKGHASVIQGTVTLNSLSVYSSIKNIKIGGNITINSGANGNFIRDCWTATGVTLSDNGSANSILIIQE